MILPRGRWEGQRSDVTPGGIGLLVLRGLLIRRVSIEGDPPGELLELQSIRVAADDEPAAS